MSKTQSNETSKAKTKTIRHKKLENSEWSLTSYKQSMTESSYIMDKFLSWSRRAKKWNERQWKWWRCKIQISIWDAAKWRDWHIESGIRFCGHGDIYVNEQFVMLTLSRPIPLRLYTLPYWSNPPFLIFDIQALWRSGLSTRAPECQKLIMALNPSNSSSLEHLALKGLRKPADGRVRATTQEQVLWMGWRDIKIHRSNGCERFVNKRQ